jgi:hypothetical protein
MKTFIKINFNHFHRLSKKKYFNLLIIVSIGLFFRLFYLLKKTGDIFLPNLGGDSCHHYNMAYNIASGIGPKTSFIFSYWFYHDHIPAMTDVYAPGYSYFLSLFLLIKDEFFFLRLSSLAVGIISILLAFFLGKIVHSKKLGYLSALIICFNFFHIENSTVVMRENFNLLLVQIFFLNLFLLKNNKILFCTLGIVIGYCTMTLLGAWIILLIIFLLYYFYMFNININFFINFGITLLFFSITAFPWAITSYDYFGEVFFSYSSYIPYVTEWSSMMYERGLPDINNFWLKVDLYEYFKNHLIWGVKNFYKFHLMVFPTFAFPLSFVTIPVIILGTYKLKFNGLVLLIFAVLYFLAISFASYAMQGQLWPRHFLVFLAPVSILLGYGLILIYDKVVKYQIFKNKLKILLKYKILIYIISILITVVGIQVKASFWERESSYFYEFGKKIKNITNENDVIIYAYTMQDLWCATKRKSISDIAFFAPQTMNRINEEIKKYNVTYLFIDTSNHIYQRPSVPDNNIDSIIELFYSSLKLKLILKDEINRYYFYKII